MQDQVNVHALNKTIEVLFGANMIETVRRVYSVIDNTMRESFQAGISLGSENGFKAGIEFATPKDVIDEQAVNAFEGRLGKDELQTDSDDEQPYYDDQHDYY